MEPSPRAARGPLLRLVVAALAIAASRASAQCADGSPPPCKSANAAAIARRVNPPLNPRAWIVVPFSNAMKTQELDWLRDASVNLLSLDLGRWSDIRVVPDKRVSDLLREVPAGQGTGALSLNDGLAIARRAGAGMLVMGDFFKLGRGARLIANVFDVKTGARVRSAVQQAPDQDSLLTAFTPLARAVLAVPPPPDAKLGDLGTTSLDAYQAYLLGVKALDRDDINEARKQLVRAIALDSTFALAHFQLSYALAWGEGDPNGGETKAHALAAQRLGAALPQRERALIDAQVAGAGGDFVRSCGVLKPLVARDSADIQALVQFGECNFHDLTVSRSATDTATGSYNGSYNVALRAFNRVLQLDPSYHVAFEHILDILRASYRGGCAPGPQGNVCGLWSSVVLRQGDTLLTVPVRPNSDAYWAQRKRAEQEKPSAVNLALARRIAQDWVEADSTSENARNGLARVLIMLGDLEGADAQFRHTSMRATSDNAVSLRNRMEVAAKLGRGAEARTLFDSLVKSVPDNPSVILFRGSMELLFGRFHRVDAGIRAAAAPFGPQALDYLLMLPRIVVGIEPPDVSEKELAWWGAMRDSSCNADCRWLRLVGTLGFALRAPRAAWPAGVDGAVPDGRLDLAHFLARHDTAAFRRAAAQLESDARRNIDIGTSEYGWSLIATDAFLLVHDTTSALRAIRWQVDTAMRQMPITVSAFALARSGMGVAGLWPRAMLTRADLAAATGSRAEAKLWYDRVLSLWADADPELQPLVARVRAARARLGP